MKASHPSLYDNDVMTSKRFHFDGPLWAESTEHRWIPPQKTNDS